MRIDAWYYPLMDHETTQSQPSASPTGAALHHSGEETTMDPAAQRAALAAAEYNSYDPEHFPGSKGWRRHQQARQALAAFDAAHPDFLAAAQMARQAKQAAEYDALSDFVKGGS